MTKRYAHATEKAKRETVQILNKPKRIEQDLSKQPAKEKATSFLLAANAF